MWLGHQLLNAAVSYYYSDCYASSRFLFRTVALQVGSQSCNRIHIFSTGSSSPLKIQLIGLFISCHVLIDGTCYFLEDKLVVPSAVLLEDLAI